MHRIMKYRRDCGFTFVELLVTMVALVIVSLGALSYYYHSVTHTNVANARLIATRTAQLLLEDWKSNGGSEHYDPSELQLGFEKPPGDDNSDYIIAIDNLPMGINMNYSDIGSDEETGVTLRQMTVMIRWRSDYQDGTITDDDPYLKYVTYVRRDTSGG